jgi:hypothetical protein
MKVFNAILLEKEDGKEKDAGKAAQFVRLTSLDESPLPDGDVMVRLA